MLPQAAQMVLFVFTIFVFIVLALRTFIMLLNCPLSSDTDEEKRVWKNNLLRWLVMLVIAAALPLVYEFPFSDEPVKIAIVTGEHVKLKPLGVFEWAPYVVLPGDDVVCENSVTFIDQTVQPPRLMKVKYTIAVEITDTRQYLLSNPNHQRATWRNQSVEYVKLVVREQAEEFNKRPSQNLLAYTNPSQDEQQRRFTDMIHDWFVPPFLNAGLSIKHVSFSIE